MGDQFPLTRQLTSHLDANSATEALGYIRREIPPDGNCLFRACAEICLGSQGRSAELRQAVHDYIAMNRGRFEPFIDECTFFEYLAKVRSDGHWGSDLELQAIAELHNIVFTVFANNWSNAVTIEPKATVIGRPLPRLAALWFSHGNHYDALYTPEEFARRGFSVDSNIELRTFREQREADEQKSLQLTRELSEEPSGGLGARASADWMIRGSDQQARVPNFMDEPVGGITEHLPLEQQLSATALHSAPPGMLSAEQRRRPTVSNLLDAGFSEAELAHQFNPLPAYPQGGGSSLPPELLRRSTVMGLLEAGVSEEEIRRQVTL